jgi:uncharacterized membrane protein YedE/YeeE
MLMLLNGRVFGISGILAGVLMPRRNETKWRVFVLAGLILGGVSLQALPRSPFDPAAPVPAGLMAAAGLLVGFGTRLGGGCTSGHGVCGIARLSPRSLVATMTFMAAGMLTVALRRWMTGGAP